MGQSRRTTVVSLVFAVLILARCGIAAPQATPPSIPTAPAMPAAAADALDHWRRATIALGVVVQDGNVSKFVTLGSAVIVALDKSRGCLLTAKHMLVNPETGKSTPFLWMRLPSISGEDEKPIALTLFDAQGHNLWITSADTGDLALIPLPDLRGRRIDAVWVSDFANPATDLFHGASVVVLGYPQIVGEAYLTFPIARGGIIAWIDPKDAAGQPFLVDANLYNGNSGGPVFRVRSGLTREGNMSIGGGLSFLGIVSKGPLQEAPVVSAEGYVYHQNPVTKAQHPEFAIVANVGGIGIIEPASRARKLLESAFAGVPPRDSQ